jgi:ribonuclease BN (tRNA processing enzyme)
MSIHATPHAIPPRPEDRGILARPLVTVLGACGAWPEAGQACSGFLVEQDGFRLVIDLGYATMPRLLEHVTAEQVDAVFISHGHPDHCADLSPLLRARAMAAEPAAALPVYAPAGALNAVLALDRPGMLAETIEVRELSGGDDLEIGPFRVQTRLLPHWLPNAGLRLSAAGRTLAYTGDSGPSPDVVDLARGADVLLAEATYADEVPDDSRGNLCSAPEAGEQAARAGAGQLILTHLWPGTDHEVALSAAMARYDGPTSIAAPGLTLELQ